MGRRLLVLTFTFFAAFGILFASIMQSSSVKQVFSQAPTQLDTTIPQVDYQLPGTGAIGPEDPLWTAEVLRDKVWLAVTNGSLDKSELLLLLANKRISYAQQLSERGDYEQAIAVSRKAEMYLSDSVNAAKDNAEQSSTAVHLYLEIAMASLKHREILERMYASAPDDARPAISQINDTAKMAYEQASHLLHSTNTSSPLNPFSN